MNLVKWEPFGNVDNFFDEFGLMPFPRFGFDLAVDVYEKNNNVVASINLPGVDPKELSVSVEDNILCVEGSREEEKEEKGKHYYSKEIKRGTFSRSVRLPKPVVGSKVIAEYDKGVLQITVPIAKEKKGSAVKIKVKT